MFVDGLGALKDPEIFRSTLVRGAYNPFSWDGMISASYYAHLGTVMAFMPLMVTVATLRSLDASMEESERRWALRPANESVSG